MSRSHTNATFAMVLPNAFDIWGQNHATQRGELKILLHETDSVLSEILSVTQRHFCYLILASKSTPVIYLPQSEMVVCAMVLPSDHEKPSSWTVLMAGHGQVRL